VQIKIGNKSLLICKKVLENSLSSQPTQDIVWQQKRYKRKQSLVLAAHANRTKDKEEMEKKYQNVTWLNDRRICHSPCHGLPALEQLRSEVSHVKTREAKRRYQVEQLPAVGFSCINVVKNDSTAPSIWLMLCGSGLNRQRRDKNAPPVT
jgi:hypothetical protein